MTMEDIIAIPPAPTRQSAPYWEACNRGELLLAKCNDCTRPFYYPRILCPHCGSRNLGWLKASGTGTVWSFTHVQVSFYGKRWESQLPYTPVLIDLDEGVRMLSRLIGEGRDAVNIGDRVRVEFIECEKQNIPYFTLAGTQR